MKAVLKAEHVYEVMRVWVNGSEVGFRMIPPYQIELTGFFRTGENEIVIEVANTPGRDQANYLSAPFDFQHEAIEPSGMFGKVLLLYK